jgi:hypothetical protein
MCTPEWARERCCLLKLRVWKSRHFEVGAPPHPTSPANRQILSHISEMRSKTGIQTWPRLVLDTNRKIYFCLGRFMQILAQRFAPEKDTLRTIATF